MAVSYRPEAPARLAGQRMGGRALQRLTCTTFITAALAFSGARVAADIPLAGIVEARGAAAPAALSFKNGYLMAIDEINAGGGVLGQLLVLSQFDIDTSPEAAEAAARKALEARPFAVIGPQFSGITAAAMKHTAASAVPHFTSGEAASLTRQFHPSLLRTSLSQSGSAPRLAPCSPPAWRSGSWG